MTKDQGRRPRLPSPGTGVASGAESERAPVKLAQLPEELRLAVDAARGKKAEDLVLLDLRGGSAFADYFVICSGQSSRQVKAIVDAIEEALRAAGVRPSHHEGYERAEWVLVDYFDFIVHVFTPETRAFYALERLWGSAHRYALPDPAR